jgi:hypothetical protein
MPVPTLPHRSLALRRSGIVALMALLGLALWTGCAYESADQANSTGNEAVLGPDRYANASPPWERNAYERQMRSQQESTRGER